MVVGDVVSQIGGDNATITFIPAAGVEVVVTWTGTVTTGTNGTNGIINAAGDLSEITGAAGANGLGNQKVFITNTNRLRLQANLVGNHVAFSGMQVGA